jgi:membrane associated rhomboid family serine protease
MLLIAVVVVAGFAWYVMSPAERTRTVRLAVASARQLLGASHNFLSKTTPFEAALQSRTPRVFVTPALVALNVVTFVMMLFGSGSLGDPETLLGWGGSFGPSTSNGEWWRLVTSMFVHAGLFSLLVNLIGLAQVGWLLERLVGPITVAAIYFGAGVFGGLVNLALHPVDVHLGATAAIVGLYGLFVASLVWTLLNRSNFVIPLIGLKPLAPAAGIFVLYVMLGGVERAPALASFATGLIGGLVLTRGINEDKPSVRRLAATVTATMAIAIVAAVPLRGLPLVKPEIARAVEVEQRTSETYGKEVAKFKVGHIRAEALAKLIEGSIIPELRATRTRLASIERVPLEQQPLVADAVEYLRLREESWQFKARALRSSSMAALHDADRREFLALQAFQKITPDDTK